MIDSPSGGTRHDTNTRCATRSGMRRATSGIVSPPIECPTSTKRSSPAASMSASTLDAKSASRRSRAPASAPRRGAGTPRIGLRREVDGEHPPGDERLDVGSQHHAPCAPPCTRTTVASDAGCSCDALVAAPHRDRLRRAPLRGEQRSCRRGRPPGRRRARCRRRRASNVAGRPEHAVPEPMHFSRSISMRKRHGQKVARPGVSAARDRRSRGTVAYRSSVGTDPRRGRARPCDRRAPNGARRSSPSAPRARRRCARATRSRARRPRAPPRSRPAARRVGDGLHPLVDADAATGRDDPARPQPGARARRRARGARRSPTPRTRARRTAPASCVRSRSTSTRATVRVVQRRALPARIRRPHRDTRSARRRRPASREPAGRPVAEQPARVARAADEDFPARRVRDRPVARDRRRASVGVTAQTMSVVPRITSTSPSLVGPGDDLLGERVDAARTRAAGRRRRRAPLPSRSARAAGAARAARRRTPTTSASHPVQSKSGYAVAAVDVSSTASPRERVVRDGLRRPVAGGVGRLAHAPAQEAERARRSRPGCRLAGLLRAPSAVAAALVAVEEPGDAAARRRRRPRSATAPSRRRSRRARRGRRGDGRERLARTAPPRDVGVVLEALRRRDAELVRARAPTRPRCRRRRPRPPSPTTSRCRCRP